MLSFKFFIFFKKKKISANVIIGIGYKECLVRKNLIFTRYSHF